jgi:hypothetical protein
VQNRERRNTGCWPARESRRARKSKPRQREENQLAFWTATQKSLAARQTEKMKENQSQPQIYRKNQINTEENSSTSETRKIGFSIENQQSYN